MTPEHYTIEIPADRVHPVITEHVHAGAKLIGIKALREHFNDIGLVAAKSLYEQAAPNIPPEPTFQVGDIIRYVYADAPEWTDLPKVGALGIVQAHPTQNTLVEFFSTFNDGHNGDCNVPDHTGRFFYAYQQGGSDSLDAIELVERP